VISRRMARRLGAGQLHRHHAGLPFAIVFFAWEQRKERDNEEEEQYQLLSDAYNDFLKVVLAIPTCTCAPTSRWWIPRRSSASACW
jgi:hypothetical protein